ncbi:MAG: 2-amino-4-hydroxy-6-hydroxymethyldihydropteridine diphosphokinase [Acidobacteria bacterium]|nr:2-amino-4-hydroxy-6-hydroxymethyldihydropteridine diphosphokinase [Acidobacteriota bacterium]
MGRRRPRQQPRGPRGAPRGGASRALRGRLPLDPGLAGRADGAAAGQRAGAGSAAGRRREVEARWGPRPLDVDLVLFGDLILDAPGLSLPHPRYTERPFITGPLLAWWPGLRDPRTGTPLRPGGPV